MNELEIGQGIYLTETPPRARLYHCDTCGKLFVDTRKKPCPRCQQTKVNFVCCMSKNKKLTIIVKGAGVP